jgi:hypothetical protein
MRKIVAAAVLLFLLPACSARETVRRPAMAPRVEVIYCRLAPGDEFVEVRLRMYGAEVDPDPAGTYLLDEGTGEKHYIMRLQRVGRVAEIRGTEGAAAHSILFRNLDRKLRPGARITLVLGSLRQEHLVLGK